MAWEHLSVTKAHLVYIILGGFTSLFMLCSSFIKERMYIGEATVATLCGVIFGPHAANLIDPASWGNVDLVTIEFSRIVLVVQCFAVGVELPKFYMERHWKSVIILLVPVMTFGWLIVSLFIWWMVPPLNWLDSLVVAACVTATDPVLASSVVGKGKFAKRVPKHLRDLLSAESGCNDGMAFPFVYLAIYLIQEHMDAGKTTFHWFVYTILYECIFGAIFGFMIGYIARHAIKFAEKRDLIDRESFLVFYFVLALFCAGSGSLLGMDDLLIGFAAGVGFSNDGWFHEKTEESHVSNVIDLLVNLAYFVYLGTIIPWEQYNNAAEGLTAWRLVVLAILVLFFRRLPIMLLLKPFIPDVKTWREAMFAGHFGPIGVGAIFVAILARAELAYEAAVPLASTPPPDSPHYTLVALIWPIVTFLVITSIIVHGSSIAVFTLGKRINTLNLTMSYTTSPEDGPSWMNRLPRISSQSRSQGPSSQTSQEDLKMPEFPPGTLPPVGVPRNFLRRQKEGDTLKPGSWSSSAYKRRKSRDNGVGPGGPVSQSAIFPTRRQDSDAISAPEESAAASSSETAADSPTEKQTEMLMPEEGHVPSPRPSPRLQVYEEGGDLLVENEDGDVLFLERSHSKTQERGEAIKDGVALAASAHDSQPQAGESQWKAFKRVVGNAYSQERAKRKTKEEAEKKHEPARAFQFGNTVVIEDEAGEVIKTYELAPPKPERGGPDLLQQCQRYLGMGGGSQPAEPQEQSESEPGSSAEAGKPRLSPPTRTTSWFRGAGEGSTTNKPQKTTASEKEQSDGRNVRFTIGQTGKRMTEGDFIREMQQLDRKTRREVVEESNAPQGVKQIATGDVPTVVHPAAATARQTSTVQQPREEIREEIEEEEGESSRSESSGRSEKQPELPLNLLPPRLDSGDQEETPAERRRREAALGVGSPGAGDSDDDEEGTPRIPPAKRGIRFADGFEQGNSKSRDKR